MTTSALSQQLLEAPSSIFELSGDSGTLLAEVVAAAEFVKEVPDLSSIGARGICRFC